MLKGTIGCLAWFCSRVLAHCQVSGFRDRRAPDYTTRQMKMVAREGAAPPIAGCRPAVILFHHRAVEVRFIKLAAGAGLAPARPPSKGGVLLIRRPGKEMVGERGLAPPRLTDSRSVGSAIPSEPLARKWCSRPESPRQPQPSESCALIIELQERLAPSHHGAVPIHGASRRCCPGTVFLQREPAGCCEEATEMVARQGNAPCSTD